MAIAHHDQDTRGRLLEAAGEVFAEKGFQNATIRDICGRAQANVAAVNYHFGDKTALYLEALKSAYRHAAENYPLPDGRALPAHEQLRLFIEVFVQRLLAQGRPAWHGKLISREMVEPTPALEHVVSDFIRPMFSRLRGIVRQIVGDTTSEAQVLMCVTSVLGQCNIYHHAREVIPRLDPGLAAGPAFLPALANHVYAFSLAGLLRVRDSGGADA